MTAAENGPREWATRMLAPGHAVILDTVICARVCLTVLESRVFPKQRPSSAARPDWFAALAFPSSHSLVR